MARKEPMFKGKLKKLVEDSAQVFAIKPPYRVEHGPLPGKYQPHAPFKCNTCPKNYVDWGNLVRHCIEAGHNGEGCHPIVREAT